MWCEFNEIEGTGKVPGSHDDWLGFCAVFCVKIVGRFGAVYCLHGNGRGSELF
jgi:hypothetical protein